MDRYPHKLYKVVVTDESENDYGQTIPGNKDTVFVSDCYEQVNGSGSEIRLGNGSMYVFSSQIFLPQGVEQIPSGTKIEVREEDDKTVRLQGEVKRPSGKDVKHSRLWV